MEQPEANLPPPPARPTTQRGRALRIGASGVSLWAASLLASILLGTRTPFELFVDRVTQFMPGPLAAYFIDNFQYWAKPLLLIGLSIAWVLFGAVVAWLFGSREQPASEEPTPATVVDLANGAAAIAVVWLVGSALLPAVTFAGALGLRLDEGPLRYNIALVVAAVAFAVVNHVLAGRGMPRFGPPEPYFDWPGRARQRRVFLGTAVGALAVGGAYVLSRRINPLVSNAKPAAAGRAAGSMVPEITPNDDFYVISKNLIDPLVKLDSWRLVADGLVEKQLELTIEDVRAMPAIERYLTLECISNVIGGNLMSTALWKGVPLRDMLAAAGTKPEGKFVASFAADDYSVSIPIDLATQEDVLLVYDMNGVPLPTKHGAPLRLLIPGRYGMKSTKWLHHLEVMANDRLGYWEIRGWDNAAVVKTMSRIDVPEGASRIPPDPLTVGGVAFAGVRGIQKMEVSFDRGTTWHEATLRPAIARGTWQLWTYEWSPREVGAQRILVRATDSAGDPQIEKFNNDTFPSGATGYHQVSVRTVEPSEPG